MNLVAGRAADAASRGVAACAEKLRLWSRVPAANAVHAIAQAAATHAMRTRDMRGTWPPPMICPMRCGRKLPGIAIPATFNLAPERATDRAMSMRYSAYSLG